jgi:hypothetical protein
MNTVQWIATTALEVFLLLAVALETVLGRVKIRGFSLGATACTLIGRDHRTARNLCHSSAVQDHLL